jgi:hypothetical protein
MEKCGFRTELNTDSPTYLSNEILNALNNNLLTGRIFCDLEMHLFVNHKILLTNLEFYGITGKHYKF